VGGQSKEWLWGGGLYNPDMSYALVYKDYEAKMFQAILMTTFSSSLFVRQQVQAKEHKE
jgi:hypothetical protein